MNEARKLDNSGLPEIPVDGARAADDDLPPLPANEAVAQRRKVPDVGRSKVQPAKDIGEPAYGEARAVSDPPARSRAQNPKKKTKGGFGRALLILFLIGFVSFAGGAGLTAGIVLGNIDTKSGKLKETIQDAKALIKQLRN